jgi:septum formation protein
MLKIAQLLNLDVPLVLASKSPRRKKLLEQLGLTFDVVPSDFAEENHSKDYLPEEYVQKLSLEKALNVARKINYSSIIIGADTIVLLDGEIINKPVDESDARFILNKLSNQTHTVLTGLSFVKIPEQKYITTYQKTLVTFRELDEDEIEAYIKSGSPLDKAGAYGIQDDFGALFVSYIEGCYYNIVGLPLELFYQTLKEFIKSNYGN